MKTNLLKRILKIAGIAISVLAVGFGLLLGVSYAIYYSPAPAELPCRNCTGEAQAVQVNGFDLYYRAAGQRGENPPLVLLHGGPGMSSQTFKQGFDFLADRYEVVYYDQRGSGNSQIKADNAYYTMDQLVEELESLRREVLQSDQMILVGHSAGGALAQRYALKYPDQVNKMILVGALPANGGFKTGGLPLDALVSMLNIMSGNIPPRDPQEADAKFMALGLQTSIPRLYDPTHPEILNDFGYVSFAVNRELTRSTYGGSYDDRLKTLTVKTLVIYGAADNSSFTGEAAAQHMSDILPNSTLVRFERSGHWPYLEEPDYFRQVLGEFLSE